MSRVLVIDDNELVARMLEEQLKQEGYEVSVAVDANMGYSTAVTYMPDLILLDVQLPDVVGFDLIRILKNRDDLREIPIIMMTGTAHSSSEKVKGFQLGADDYVLKPFDMPELLGRIAAILRRSQGKRTTPAAPAPALAATTPAAAAPSLPASVVVSASSTSPAPAPVSTTQNKPFNLSTPVSAPQMAPKGSPAEKESVESLSLAKSIIRLLLAPLKYPRHAAYPPSSMAFLAAALTLGFIGLGFAAGPAIKPAVYALLVLLSWVTVVSVLVMTSSVIGVALTWKEGGRLFSLAMTPLILKLAGATVSSAWTSLSPFYFNAGPAVLMKTSTFWTERLDIFELWSMALLWWLLCKRPASNPKRALTISGIVWLTLAALAAAAQKMGS